MLGDSFYFSKEAIRYSTALAERLDAVLVLLMLLPFESVMKVSRGGNMVLKLQNQAAEAIKQPIEDIEKAGIRVESAIRIDVSRNFCLINFTTFTMALHLLIFF